MWIGQSLKMFSFRSSLLTSVAVAAPLAACGATPPDAPARSDASATNAGGAGGSGAGDGDGRRDAGPPEAGLPANDAGGTTPGITPMREAGAPDGALPALPNVPGVEVVAAGVRSCVAVCVQNTNPALDPQGDDWSYESGRSCIIPGTATASNDPCMTGAPLPAPLAHPGVVTLSAAGQRECVPKCVFYTSPTQRGANGDGFADDWAYENNSTCVIPSTITATINMPCTTGQPVPIDPPRPGVIVRNPVSTAMECIATCKFFASRTQPGANGDNLGDDWAFESGSSCIIPGTVTAANQSCTTQQPLPPVEPRPGIMVNADPLIDSCTATACVPLCRVVTVAPDPKFPDWAWENNNSCVIAGSPTATVLPKSVENHGYAVPPRKCTWAAPTPNFLAPPALIAARTVQPHFQVMGAQVRDPYGQPFVPRGVNNSHAWFDICGQYSAYEALDNIAAQGANAVRVGWAFESIDPGGPLLGEAQKRVIGTNAKLLAEILHRVVELKMIPILAINDTTGQTLTAEPLRMARLLATPAYKEVLLAYEPYLMVGIANEWNGTDFYNAYLPAIQYLRTNGIRHPLVVTANAWGQGCDSLLMDGPRLTTADPLHNLLFDIHIYNYLTLNGAFGGTAAFVQGCMDAVAAARLPLLVGEFGHTHGGTPVQWQTVIARANANAQGFTAWLWYGDTEFPVLNLAQRWEGPLTTWGEDVFPLTAARASIFP